MKKIITLLILLTTISVFGQEKLSLNDCYILVDKNYPLAKQFDLLAQQNVLDLAIIQTEKLPKLDFSAQATYQSEVTQIPVVIPNNPVEAPNKDQYKATFSANQLIYDGGLINASAEVKNATLKKEQKQVEVNLYQLKKQINQYYFSILLVQEKYLLWTAKKNLLDAKLKEVKAGIKYGVLLPTSDKVIAAELLKIEQQFAEMEQHKIRLISALSKLTGKEISFNTAFQNPEIKSDLSPEIHRPELDLFQLQKSQIETAEQLISKKNNPKIVGFATGGYGNPGLNMLDNSFQPYYLAGIKLNWNVFDWNSSKKEQKSLQINKDLVDNQQEIFKLTTSIELDQQLSEINKMLSFIQADLQIIELRKEILAAADAQLKNGVITASAYITELTNLYEAENNWSDHQIQLIMAKANYQITKGN
ncbi:MAG: TolC family protein [Flavobacteriaceae bacterium]|nr:TolC family protein [Flavobacteriaceae bacterium]